MAVLVGVITPQYIKYVEKSKAAVDMQTMDTLRNAMNVTVLDPNIVQVPISSDITDKAIGGDIGTYNDAFWNDVYSVMGVNNAAGVKALLELDNGTSVNITYSYSVAKGTFSIKVSGGKYTGNRVSVHKYPKLRL